MVGLAFAGAAVYSVVNTIVVFGVLMIAGNNMDGDEAGAVIAVAAAFLALLGLGAGIGLVLVRKPWAIGLGLGLMIGWALWSIITAGWCTGLNPALYGS